MKRLAVIGYPIGHSRSPAMQTAALEEEGLAGQWEYGAIEVEPDGFAELVGSLPGQGYVGVNVTIPHKHAALALADEASEAATAIGAANTLSFADGRISAENTDAPGVLEALAGVGFDPAGKTALVLGAGGSSRAVVWGLAGAGAEVTVWNRTPERAAELAAELGAEAANTPSPPAIEGFSLLVNTTSVGLERTGDSSSQPPATFKDLGLDVDQVSGEQAIVDLVYGSDDTELIAAGRRAGAKVVDGREILVRQGAISFQIWTGRTPSAATMRAAV